MINSKYIITDSFEICFPTIQISLLVPPFEKFDENSYTLAPTGMRMNRLLFKKKKSVLFFNLYFSILLPIPSLLGLASILTLCIFFLHFGKQGELLIKLPHNVVLLSLVYQLQEIPKQAEKGFLQTGDEFEFMAEKSTICCTN